MKTQVTTPNELEIRVERVHYGFLVAPEGTRDAGQPIPVVGYVVRHPDGLFLFDTGFAPIDDATRAASRTTNGSSDHTASNRRRRRALGTNVRRALPGVLPT